MSEHIVYIGLGSNLGDREHHITEAYNRIKDQVGAIERQSGVYVSPPWGFEASTDFFNSVISVKTSLTANEVLTKLMEIEVLLGRTRSGVGGYESRTIDLDIIDYDGVVQNTPDLSLPHPQMHLRKFVLVPLLEIAPEWKHPVFHQTAADLISALEKQGT